jgi:gamma-glutamyl-gamma-aminobutyrate hydrolase PuuD
MESYDAGQEFPIYGTCQGIQLLSMLTSGNSEIKEDCKVHNADTIGVQHTRCRRSRVMFDTPGQATLGISKPLHFTEHARESRLFSSLSPQLYDMLATKPCGEHLHSSCITTKAFKGTPTTHTTHTHTH